MSVVLIFQRYTRIDFEVMARDAMSSDKARSRIELKMLDFRGRAGRDSEPRKTGYAHGPTRVLFASIAWPDGCTVFRDMSISTTSAKRPVLIVDDDDVLREILANQLIADGGFVVTEASSVQEAEARLSAKNVRFDAVILDIRLPDGDGRELCARLCKRGMRMPIIILTESAGEADMMRKIDSGDQDYFV
jgi:CheY-like chemotaxis protein